MNEIQRKFSLMKRKVYVIHLGEQDRLATDLLKAYATGDSKLKLVSNNSTQVLATSSGFVGYDKPAHVSPSWSTYAGCFVVALDVNGLVYVEVWDGDLYDGRPTNIRYKAVFEMPWWDNPRIFESVEAHWKSHVKAEWERRKEIERNEEYARISAELLQ